LTSRRAPTAFSIAHSEQVEAVDDAMGDRAEREHPHHEVGVGREAEGGAGQAGEAPELAGEEGGEAAALFLRR